MTLRVADRLRSSGAVTRRLGRSSSRSPC